MDYNIKYLKYKNKYINLKNMIGNGEKSPEQIKKELIDYLKKEKIASLIINAISVIYEKHKINKAEAKHLINELKGIYDYFLRSNLLFNLIIFDISAKEIKNIIDNLFITKYDLFKEENNFGITEQQDRYEKIIFLFIFNFTREYNSKPPNQDTIEIIHGKQLKTLSQFTQIQFYLLKKILSKKYYRDILIIEPIIKIIKDIKIPDEINQLVQSGIEKTTKQDIAKALDEKLNELIKEADIIKIEADKQNKEAEDKFRANLRKEAIEREERRAKQAAESDAAASCATSCAISCTAAKLAETQQPQVSNVVPLKSTAPSTQVSPEDEINGYMLIEP